MANPTKDQLAAIHERNRTLLVSAAAGAGKTFTLTRRIIETIKGGGNLSQMLIVTFTRAAAAELRERISTALNTAIAEEGYSAHLCRQLLALPTAKISTIDSFCLDLVRANAADLGLSPTFRLSDTAENQLLLASIAKNLATKSAWLIRYVALIGSSPNLKCEIVTPPDFFES